MIPILKVGMTYQTAQNEPVKIIGQTSDGYFLGEYPNLIIYKYFIDGTPQNRLQGNLWDIPKPRTYRYFNIYENHTAFGGNQYSGYDDQSEAERSYRNRPNNFFKRVAMIKMDLETFEVSNVPIK